MPKKIFRVQAECITYCYIDIEADSIDEANEIAEETDGGDFTSDENFGGWNVLDSLTREKTPEDKD